jgi:hypothetical protein
MDFGAYNLLVYASLRGLPVAIIVRFIMRPRRRAEPNLPKALAGGILGVYACWHVGIAAAGKETWNPMLSLIPVAVAEFAAYLSTVLELKQECVARKGAQFILPGGQEIWVPKTAPLTGVVAGLVGAFILLQIGNQVRIEFLVTLFRQKLIETGLTVVGIIALLDIPFMASRIASVPNKG